MNVNVHRLARPGRVVELTGDGYYLVEVGGGTVPAYLSDQSTAASVGLDSVVTLLPMLGGFEIVSVRTGPSGGGGVVLGPEIVANGGFESGTPGELPTGWTCFWNYSGGEPQPLSTSTDSPLVGAQCAKVTVVPGDWGAHNSASYRAPSRIDGAANYRMAAYVSGRIVNGAGVTVRLELISAATEADCQFFNANATLKTVASLSAPGEAWPLITGDVTVPTGHSWFRPILRVVADAGSNLTIRWDQVSLRQRLA